MEPKMARRIVRHMSASNKTVRLWFKLIFTGLELLLASNYITLCSSAPIFSNPSRVTLKLFGVHIPSFLSQQSPGSRLLLSCWLHSFSSLTPTNASCSSSSISQPSSTYWRVCLSSFFIFKLMSTSVKSSSTSVSPGLSLAYSLERASYRADQGLYELKRTVMESNKTRSEK